jgi:hypothetical protein
MKEAEQARAACVAKAFRHHGGGTRAEDVAARGAVTVFLHDNSTPWPRLTPTTPSCIHKPPMSNALPSRLMSVRHHEHHRAIPDAVCEHVLPCVAMIIINVNLLFVL